jgi:N-methylhydantoinase A
VLADLRCDFVHTVWRPLREVGSRDAEAVLADQRQRGTRTIEAQGVPVTALDVVHEADLLYRGQSHVFRVPVDGDGFDAARIAASLADRYRARFEIELKEMTPVLANLRTTVIGRRPPLDLLLLGRGLSRATRPEPIETREVWFTRSFEATPVYAREAIGVGSVIEGPAIVQQADATVLIDPGARATCDALGNLVIDV